jgi:hypothetical protein
MEEMARRALGLIRFVLLASVDATAIGSELRRVMIGRRK